MSEKEPVSPVRETVHGRGETATRKAAALSIVPLLILVGEFLWFGVFQLLPYNGPRLSVVHAISCANASQWVITPCNPLGQATSFLVFDGWNNVLTIGVAAFIVGVLSLFTTKRYPLLVSLSLFVITNLAGIVAPTAIYFGPASDLADWGMSAAAFGSLGFAFVASLWVLFTTLPKGGHKTGRDKLITVLLLVLVLGGLALVTTVTPTVYNPDLWQRTLYVHLLSLATGLVFGGIVFWGIGRDGKSRGVVAFRRPIVKEWPS